MARKRSLFFGGVQSFLKGRYRYWLRFLLSLLTIGSIICFSTTATIPVATSAIPNFTPSELIRQGKSLYETGQFVKAVEVLQQAAADFEAANEPLEEAVSLSNLSLAYQQLGQWQRAEEAISQSLNILQSEPNLNDRKERSQILAQSLDVRGRLQLTIGQTEAALNSWQQAATLYTEIGDDFGLARNRINFAQALQALGLYRQAQTTLTQVNQNLQQQPDSVLKVTGLRSLGNVLRVIGNLEASRKVLTQSRSVATKLQSDEALDAILLSLGNTARAQKDTQAALKFYQLAAASISSTTRLEAQLNQLRLAIEKEQWQTAQALWTQIQSQIADLPPSRTAVYAKINFAQSLLRLKQYDPTNSPSWQDIARLLAASVRQARELADRRSLSYALGNFGNLYERTQQWNEALDLTQEALFVAQTIDASDIAYLWQWQLGRIQRNQGNLNEAIAAYAQATKSLESIRSDLVAISPDVQFDFRDRVEPIYRQQVDLLLQSEDETVPNSQNLQLARTAIESLQLAELENFFRSDCLEAKPELIDLVVDRDDRTAAVLYPVILPNRIEVVLKLPTQASLQHYTTKIPQREVKKTIEELRQYLKEPDRTNDVQQLSQRLYSWLIQPLEPELEAMQVTKLVFVLDGALRQIPMAVLYDGRQQKYLIEKYAIALTPGLQLLEPKTLQRDRLQALTAGLSESRQVAGIEFPQLQNVKQELKQIESEVPRSDELLNREFTKTNIQERIELTPFNIVHMATHGQFSSNKDETFILSWDRLLKIDDLDDLLRTNALNKPDAIELLVLSACETAAGDNRAALGLAGIAVRAGARSTLATLWSVDDRSTAELMSEFYRQLADTNLTKAEALQRAQLALWNNKGQDWKRPYFWAAYVLVGNWL